MIFKNRIYSLKKSKHIFFQTLKLYNRKKKSLLDSSKESVRQNLESLQNSLIEKDKNKANASAKSCEKQLKTVLKKTQFDHIKDFIGALVFALVIAIIVRQMWFEFYEIPTGSMRPTLKEKDRLVVSKNQYGVNIPLTTSHFYFQPQEVKRGGIVVFTGKNMDIPDVDTLYFYIFPGKKQYIKRMIGKPGDCLYFYGGKIYGINSEGADISHELQNSQLKNIDHIPFIYFEGKALTPRTPTNGIYTPVVIYQMNEPVAKLSTTSDQKVIGEMLPIFHEPEIRKYDQLWGFRNYATARLLTKDELTQIKGSLPEKDSQGDLYLELTHDPNLRTATLKRDLFGRLRPSVGLSHSYIPLNKNHLQVLMDHLYTARFIVEKNGAIYRYGYKNNNKKQQLFSPKIEGVPPGTYEFYHGVAYQILWQGITKKLPKSHPIYTFSLERIWLFFNLGIEFDTRFSPETKFQGLTPSRYAFFRQGDLYVMGAKTLEKTDPILKEFVRQEHEKQIRAPVGLPYTPFIDHGPPLLEDGSIDVHFIKQYGITIPPKSYLVLGDNYAMSADSRDFGFVPEGNLRGVAEFIFWPPGNRFGFPNQPPYPFWTISRVIIWFLAAIVITFWIIIHRKMKRLPKKID